MKISIKLFYIEIFVWDTRNFVYKCNKLPIFLKVKLEAALCYKCCIEDAFLKTF